MVIMSLAYCLFLFFGYSDSWKKLPKIIQDNNKYVYINSKEQEQEQRALLLKRLAFVIFCSDIDQYQKQMPDITGKNSLMCVFSYWYSPSTWYLFSVNEWLAFAIFWCDVLVDCPTACEHWTVPLSPAVQAAVFLIFFRVILSEQ